MKKNKTSDGAGTAVTIKKPFRERLAYDLKHNWMLYLMILPVVLYYLVFKFGPMFGLSIAFMDYKPVRGFFRSTFVGQKHFKNFFTDYYFGRLLINTIRISLFDLLTFPAPILLALLLNELRSPKFAKITQNITYMPHFLSTVVICGIVVKLTASNGGITTILNSLSGVKNDSLLNHSGNFLPVYILSGLWQTLGWNSIIYLAALAGINQELYDAAKVDGANRFEQVLHVTLPGIAPTIIVMLILKMGKIFDVGYEKILLLYNPMTYDVADVINTFVYRKGLLEAQYSYSTAVGLFNSLVCFVLVMLTNKLTKKLSGMGLW